MTRRPLVRTKVFADTGLRFENAAKETNAVSNTLPTNEEFPPAVKVAARKEIQHLALRKREQKGQERKEEGVHQSRIASFLRIMKLSKLEEECHPQERRMHLLAFST